MRLKVWGECACFTRPEMKVERVTYPVMTPSAARGVLEAIFWKPEFYWQIKEIHILRPVRYMSIMRNELENKAPSRSALSRDGIKPIYIDDDRQQRNTLMLRDVAYGIVADIVLKAHAQDPVAKYRDIFWRRVDRGQCFYRPYLGCREFSAWFSRWDKSEQAVDITEEIGPMLFDLDYISQEGTARPVFFPARLVNGVLHVPPHLYQKVGWANAAAKTS